MNVPCGRFASGRLFSTTAVLVLSFLRERIPKPFPSWFAQPVKGGLGGNISTYVHISHDAVFLGPTFRGFWEWVYLSENQARLLLEDDAHLSSFSNATSWWSFVVLRQMQAKEEVQRH